MGEAKGGYVRKQRSSVGVESDCNPVEIVTINSSMMEKDGGLEEVYDRVKHILQ